MTRSHLLVVSRNTLNEWIIIFELLKNQIIPHQLVLCALGCNYALGELEPPPGVPAFIRSAVEQRPRVSYRPTSPFFMKQSLVMRNEFGTMSLPLRSAVESIPSVSWVPTYQPNDLINQHPLIYLPPVNSNESPSAMPLNTAPWRMNVEHDLPAKCIRASTAHTARESSTPFKSRASNTWPIRSPFDSGRRISSWSTSAANRKFSSTNTKTPTYTN